MLTGADLWGMDWVANHHLFGGAKHINKFDKGREYSRNKGKLLAQEKI